MYAKIILYVTLGIIAAVLQIAVISAFARGLHNLNLIIVILIFLISLSSFYYAWWWAVGMGTVMSIFSFLPFGVEVVSLALSVLLTRFLLVSFFTNRSLYSFLFLTLFSLLSYKIILLALTSFIYLVNGIEMGVRFDSRFWTNELYALLFNLGAVVIGFYLVNILSKSLKPVFLFRGK